MAYVLDYSDIGMKRIQEVGGKNAIQAEIFNHLEFEGVFVPEGFVVTASAYQYFLKYNRLEPTLYGLLRELDVCGFSNLAEIGLRARDLVMTADWPERIREEIISAHVRLSGRCLPGATFAVRGSIIPESGYGPSFSGGLETILNVSSRDALLSACKRIIASRFSDAVIRFRVENAVDHIRVSVSIGIQRMIRSPSLWIGDDIRNQDAIGLSEAEGLRLLSCCRRIEGYFGQRMEVEWAKEGLTGNWFILQARPALVA